MRPHAFAATVFIGLSLAAIAAGADQNERARQRETTRFRAMDTNNDGVITRKEWRGSDQSFRAHDWNGDGILSGNEVRVGATREVEEDDYDQARRPRFYDWTERGFGSLDHNSDGRISRAEWHYDLESFRRADRNRDGILTRAEFLGEDVDYDREDRFDYLDANRNGRVERSEWHGSRDSFDWLDVNNDNVLSRAEMVGEDADETDLFASLDINGDDVITQDEWHWSRRSFNRQDTNSDGRLSRSELTNAELSAANPAAVGTSGRTVIVDATRRWVDTGIDVRSGEAITIQAEGTVVLSENTSDVAGPGGSRSGRRAQNAPIPDQPAGALIARIDDSAPISIGDRQTFTANRAGRLYLSVNDDHLMDNRGQFRVSIEQRR